MKLHSIILRVLGRRPGEARIPARRRVRRVMLACDPLEGRVTPAHASITHHVAALVHSHHSHKATETSTATTTGTTTSSSTTATTDSTPSGNDSGSSGSSSSNTALTTALQTLQNDVLAIEQNSGTTVAEIAAIRTAFDTLSSDGLTPSSQSALQSFENSLVTAYASGATLAGDSSLLSQFEALYQLADIAGDDRPHRGLQRPGRRRDLVESHIGRHLHH